MAENVITKQDRVHDWREKCCNQCRYKFIKHKGNQLQCDFSKCTDEEVLEFDKRHGCQGIREYLETGIFPERARKKVNPCGIRAVNMYNFKMKQL